VSAVVGIVTREKRIIRKRIIRKVINKRAKMVAKETNDKKNRRCGKKA